MSLVVVDGGGSVVRVQDWRGVLGSNPGRAASELYQFRLPHFATYNVSFGEDSGRDTI